MTLHPQSLLLAIAGAHLLDCPSPVSGASIVRVMSDLGVGESASRSVLQRVTSRGLIQRVKEGRRTFYSLTERGQGVLADGRSRMFPERRTREWDGSWTLIRLRVPEERRKQRHQMSSALKWMGFGLLDGGTWVAPGERDVQGGLGLEGSDLAPLVMYGRPQEPTTDSMLVGAFDLDEVAAEYRAFGRKWAGVEVDELTPMGALVRRVELQAEWLALVRSDPRLPEELLPADWPGTELYEFFRGLDGRLRSIEEAVIDAFVAGDPIE